jgi:FkbM family methyltransferase
MGIINRITNLLEKNPRLREKLNNRLHKNGVEVIHGISPFRALFTLFGINQILDVGANTGQYARRIRKIGYKGEIISFEPIHTVYEKLAQNAATDPLWTAINMGCGDYDGEAVINISENSLFSSILPQTALLQTKYFNRTNYVNKEEIKICTIDKIFNRFYTTDKKVLLKIDAQGFEKKVLDGSRQSLKDIMAIQLELSFVAHYEGEPLIKEMLDYMFAEGFTLVAQEPLQNNFKKKKLLKGDGIFFRLDRV